MKADMVEFTCMGCGRRAHGEFYNHHFYKPHDWFEREDKDGVQLACSRKCIAAISQRRFYRIATRVIWLAVTMSIALCGPRQNELASCCFSASE